MEKVLTVAVPMYNVQQYVGKCLDSFLIEGIGRRIEVLAIDDGSFDGTSDIAKCYARKYPQLFRYIRKENGGHGSAVNTGLWIARGRYFMVVDGDDWVKRDDFRMLVTELVRSDADLAVSHYVRVKNGQETVVYARAPVYGRKIKFSRLKVSEHYFVLASICYRTELLKRARLRLPEKVYYDDLMYITEPMRLVETVVFLDIAPYRYRVGLESQSTAKKRMAQNYLQHRKIVCRLLHDYSHKMADLEGNTVQMQYIRSVVRKALSDNYYILLQNEPDVCLAACRLKQMDAFLWKHDARLFQELPRQVRLLKLMRKSGYRLLYLYRIFAAVKRLCVRSE